ncbi:MAG: hypothetical protein F9K46_00750 [Anaerolineae bacterium]|nr:MAG: hypothetical protein F9K46_00750 [Anaerolineae bacterium]
MAQFIAYDPNVEVSGAVILAAIAHLKAEIVPLLEKHEIFDVQPDKWYPLQSFLNVLKSINDGWSFGSSAVDLMSIGMQIPENAMWPPNVDSVGTALGSIDTAYHINHRGGEIGHYHIEFAEPHHIRMVCENPYPSDFDYGIIYRTVKKFAHKGQTFQVQRADSPSRLKGDDMCIYDIFFAD